MFNAVGGSTIHWSGHFPRFRPSDFRVRTLDGVADDWPLTYWDLAPYYDQNDAFIGVSGLHGDPAYPPRPPRHGPPQGLGPGGGLRAGPGAPRLALVAFGQRPPLRSPRGAQGESHEGPLGGPHGAGRAVCNACAPATWAAPPGPCPAPTSPTGRRRSRGSGAAHPGPSAEITVDRQGQARGPSTTTVREGAGATGAPGGAGRERRRHPRLLLNSVSGRFPAVWRTQRAGGAQPHVPPRSLRQRDLRRAPGRLPGPLGTFLHCQEFYETDPRRGFLRGFQLQLCRDGGPLMTALGASPSTSSPGGRAPPGPPGALRPHPQRLRDGGRPARGPQPGPSPRT